MFENYKNNFFLTTGFQALIKVDEVMQASWVCMKKGVKNNNFSQNFHSLNLVKKAEIQSGYSKNLLINSAVQFFAKFPHSQDKRAKMKQELGCSLPYLHTYPP